MKTTRADFEKELAEHRSLRATAAELKAYLEQPRPDLSSEEAHAWASSLAKRLVDFHDKVYRHFRGEERSGFMERLLKAAPRATRTVAVLQSDHDRILADLRSLLQSVMVYAEHKQPETTSLRSWTLAILEHFEEHEREETDLVQQLTMSELGAGD